MSNFTKGPWFLDGYVGETAHVSQLRGPSGEYICGDIGSYEIPYDDARLMAAAPGLFNALEDLLESYRLMACGQPLCYEERKLREEQAANAIATAVRP